MRNRPRLKVSVIVGVMISISFYSKYYGTQSVAEPSAELVAQGVITSMGEAGYELKDIELNGSKFWLGFRNGRCSLELTRVTRYGTDAASLKSRSSSKRQVAFIYRGRVYQDSQPTVGPAMDRIGQKLNSYIGGSYRYYPIYGVIYESSCNLAEFDWVSVGEF